MSTPAAFDTTLLVPAASAGSQPSGPGSPWSPVRQVPRSVAPPIVELAEMEGGRSATVVVVVVFGKGMKKIKLRRVEEYSTVCIQGVSKVPGQL